MRERDDDDNDDDDDNKKFCLALKVQGKANVVIIIMNGVCFCVFFSSPLQARACVLRARILFGFTVTLL